MIVVSDTTILSNLLKIGKIELLKDLFGEIILPESVYKEINSLISKRPELEFFKNQDWIQIKSIKNLDLLKKLLVELDDGEAEAICLANELNANKLLIDEKLGRAVAEKLNIEIIGTLGIIVEAKNKHLIESIEDVMIELKDIGFWIHESLYQKIIKLEK
jgi:predicted nucleic acid-binding protein